jgi:hypothetical protein
MGSHESSSTRIKVDSDTTFEAALIEQIAFRAREAGIFADRDRGGMLTRCQEPAFAGGKAKRTAERHGRGSRLVVD